jgi:DNA-directed RNA polymerase specialized sigma24 family protein
MSRTQAALTDFESATAQDLGVLTEAERDAYEAVERGEHGVREYARKTDRRPGTVGNLLQRAREKIGEAGGQE